MGLYEVHVLPRLVERSCGTPVAGRWRKRAMQGLSGVVVEPGFGSGHSLEHYPDAVTKVYAVDPSELGQKLAASRLAASLLDVEFAGLDGQALPLDDNSCDAALLSFTLCTIPDPQVALRELRRVVKPGGWLHYVEHGLAEDPKIQKWQHRIDPFQKKVAGGCHVSRDHPRLIEDAGFQLVWADGAYVKGPKPWSYFHIGRALNPIEEPDHAER